MVLVPVEGLASASHPNIDTLSFKGHLTPRVEAEFSQHVVGRSVILPGVGYVETVFAYNPAMPYCTIAFVRPCSLSASGAKSFRHTQHGLRAFDIASLTPSSPSGATFVAHAAGNLGVPLDSLLHHQTAPCVRVLKYLNRCTAGYTSHG